MSLRSIVATAVVGAGCVVFGAGPAVAGEVTGQGKPITIHAKSPCAFSGQEDLQFSDPANSPGRVQNWGHTPNKSGGANDTFAFGFEWGCNARDFPLK